MAGQKDVCPLTKAYSIELGLSETERGLLNGSGESRAQICLGNF